MKESALILFLVVGGAGCGLLLDLGAPEESDAGFVDTGADRPVPMDRSLDQAPVDGITPGDAIVVDVAPPPACERGLIMADMLIASSSEGGSAPTGPDLAVHGDRLAVSYSKGSEGWVRELSAVPGAFTPISASSFNVDEDYPVQVARHESTFMAVGQWGSQLIGLETATGIESTLLGDDPAEAYYLTNEGFGGELVLAVASGLTHGTDLYRIEDRGGEHVAVHYGMATAPSRVSVRGLAVRRNASRQIELARTLGDEGGPWSLAVGLLSSTSPGLGLPYPPNRTSASAARPVQILSSGGTRLVLLLVGNEDARTELLSARPMAPSYPVSLAGGRTFFGSVGAVGGAETHLLGSAEGEPAQLNISNYGGGAFSDERPVAATNDGDVRVRLVRGFAPFTHFAAVLDDDALSVYGLCYRSGPATGTP